MKNLARTVRTGLIGALILIGQSALAAPVLPEFDSFGNLTALNGDPVSFGGSGIPTDPAAIRNFVVGNDTVRVGLIATPRFGSPTPNNDGAGTYSAQTGESAPGRSLWNFSFYAESTGNLADAGIRLYYDLDAAAGNDLSTLGYFDISAALQAAGSDENVIQGSENLGFGYLASGAPGVIPPFPLPSAFDPFAPGEYSFRIGVDGGDFAAINVNVAAVPLPAGLPLLITALGGLVWLRRRNARA